MGNPETMNKGNTNAGVQLSLRNQSVKKGATLSPMQLPSTMSIGIPRAKQIAEILSSSITLSYTF